MKKGLELVILLAGGDKGSQAKDIKQAINLSNELRE
jgi:putative component of toxin-antitoxin plasmid stabilization module